MKFEVPDGFLELLTKCGDYSHPSTSTIIEVLEWASENSEAAGRVAEEAERLNETGRRAFEKYMFWLSYKPDKALEKAFELQEENRARRSLLTKVIAHAKRGGYILKMPNGLECRITRDGDHYAFRFKMGGADVTVLHSGRFIGEALNGLSRFSTFSSGKYGIRAIILDGKNYSWKGKAGNAILEAIQRNINPYVYMAIEGGG